MELANQKSEPAVRRPPPPLDSKARERLLTGAIRLFARKGYASTTVREIVAEAGVTKPVLYYYFKNKEGLYLEILHQVSVRYGLLLDDARNRRGAVVNRLLHLADQVLALFLEQIEVVRLAYAIYYGPPQGAPPFNFDTYHLKFQELVAELVQDGIHRQEFRRGRAEDITWMVLGTVNMALEIQLSHPEMGLGRPGLRRVLKLLFAGLRGS